MKVEHLIQDLEMSLVGRSSLTLDSEDVKSILRKIYSLEYATAELLRLLNEQRDIATSRAIAI